MRITKRDFFKSISAAFTVPGVLNAARNSARVEIPEDEMRVEPASSDDFWRAARFEMIEGREFDTVRFKAGSQLPVEIPFFTTPMGHNCPITGAYKDSSTTSMICGGEFPAPWHVVIRRVRLYAVTDEARTLRLLAQGSLDLSILQRFYLRAPLVDLLSQRKPDLSIASYSEAQPPKGYAYLLAPYMPFRVNVYTSQSIIGPPLELTAVLDTAEMRPIQ